MEKIYDDIEEVLIPQNVLQKRIEELGAQITKDLDGEDVVVIGVLKGCVIFLSDIFRHLDMKCDLDFMVFGGHNFKLTNIFALAEDLREAFDKPVDVFEIHEVNTESGFYDTIMKERLCVA